MLVHVLQLIGRQAIVCVSINISHLCFTSSACWSCQMREGKKKSEHSSFDTEALSLIVFCDTILIVPHATD